MLLPDRDGIWRAGCGRGAYWLGALVPTGGQAPLGARAVLDTGCVRGDCVRRRRSARATSAAAKAPAASPTSHPPPDGGADRFEERWAALGVREGGRAGGSGSGANPRSRRSCAVSVRPTGNCGIGGVSGLDDRPLPKNPPGGSGPS